MRKEIIGRSTKPEKSHEDTDWLDLESLARVELTSEDPSFPIENALSTNPERNEMGWRAATPGPQTIALVFTVPTLKNFRPVVDERAGSWVGVTAEGDPLLTRNIGTQEIYDLSVRWP